MTFTATLSPAHAATLRHLAGLSSLDAIGRLYAMPKALSVALCASCGVSREDHAWASKVHTCSLAYAMMHRPD